MGWPRTSDTPRDGEAGASRRLARELAWFATPLGIAAVGGGLLYAAAASPVLTVPACFVLSAGIVGLLRALVLSPTFSRAHRRIAAPGSPRR